LPALAAAPKLRQPTGGGKQTLWPPTGGQEYAWERVVSVEWDPAKNRANQRKHRISFHFAQRVFHDPRRVDDYDDREYAEDRWIVIGMVGSVILYVIYTLRDGNIRLISARKAAPHEQAQYLSGTAWK
jgi:uncharacterized DUF497 family protein